MRTRIRDFLIPSVFENEDQKRIAKLLSAIFVTLFLIAVVRSIFTALFLPEYLPTILRANGVLVVVLAALFLIMRAGKVNAACILFTFYQWLTVAWLTYLYGGVNLSAYGFFIFVVLSAGLLLGGRWSLGYAAASSLYGLLLVYLENRGLISPFTESPVNAFNVITPSFITTGVLVYLYSREITQALAEARRRTAELTKEMSIRKQIEKQLVQAQKMEAIGTLAGGIAHDLNNILSSVFGFTELARMKVEMDEQIDEELDEVLNAGVRARELVKHILTFSRQTDFEKRLTEIRPLITESLKFLKATLPSTIEITYDLGEFDSTVLADPTQIHQILMNLCTNAAHSMKEKGGVLHLRLRAVEVEGRETIQIKELKAGKYVQLTVSDTGHGISKEHINNIFDPFFTTKDSGEGTGMGLSVVHGIVKAHEGAIKVYSEPGQGATFHVYLPLTESETKRNGPNASKPVPLGTERILFVDDESVLADMGRQMLERLGYTVTARTSSIEALEIFKAKPEGFDLVITDQTMPKLTGVDLTKEILAIRSDMPVIICTGFSAQISPDKAEAIGARRVLMKPLVAREVAESIREVLDQK